MDRLCTVEDKAVRADIEQRMITERWSYGQLNQELRTLHGASRRQGGRRPLPFATPEDALIELLRTLIRLHRWAEVADVDEIDEDLAGKIKQLLGRARSLERDIEDELG